MLHGFRDGTARGIACGMTITIRHATLDDVPALHALVERAYRGDAARAGWTHEADLLDGQRSDVPSLTALVGEPRNRFLLALDDGMLVGSVALLPPGPGVAHLGMLAVEPARQGDGIGKRLIAAAEEEAACEGARAVEMTVIRQRPELIAWYARRGYHPTGEERPFPLDDPRFGIPRNRELGFVVLEKPLTA